MDLQLFEHNKKAYESARRLMEETGKAAVVHPTGTGKSLLAFQLAFDCPEKTVVWLSPSACIFQTQLENVKKIIRKSEDSLYFSSERYGKKRQKDSRKVYGLRGAAEWEKESSRLFKNIRFLTYAKLMHNENQIESLNAEYIVLDEFHRCGAQEWGKSVKRLLSAYPNAQVLGLSATHVRYLDGQRDMAQELFEGNIASEMSLGEAVGKGILPAPVYICAMYGYGKELEYLEKRIAQMKDSIKRKENESLMEKLRRTLEQAEGLDVIFERHMRQKRGKYLVFCSNKEHMEEMVLCVAKWFQKIDLHPHIYRIFYDSPQSVQQLEAFKKDTSHHLRLLFCIDMLNEGVHVEETDGVILLRPTVSPGLYLQQIGRGLVVGGSRKPLIFDLVNNFAGLYSVYGIMEEAAQIYGAANEKRWKLPFGEYFQIVDEVRESRLLFETIQKNLSVSWDQYYQAAAVFFKRNGHLRIPKNYVSEDGLEVGRWLMTQRRLFNGKIEGTFNRGQIEKLNAIGMEWEDSSGRKWKYAVEKLKQYQEKQGNVDIPTGYVSEDGFPLGKWVSNLRSK